MSASRLMWLSLSFSPSRFHPHRPACLALAARARACAKATTPLLSAPPQAASRCSEPSLPSTLPRLVCRPALTPCAPLALQDGTLEAERTNREARALRLEARRQEIEKVRGLCAASVRPRFSPSPAPVRPAAFASPDRPPTHAATALAALPLTRRKQRSARRGSTMITSARSTRQSCALTSGGRSLLSRARATHPAR